MSRKGKRYMNMQERIFTVPCIGGEEINEELNRFLRTNKVVGVAKQFYSIDGNAFWSFCVEYLNVPVMQTDKKEKVDYKNVLDSEAFAVFTKLRTIRKQFADEDGVPAYAVFTDAELAEISKLGEITEGNVKAIHGIGDKRVDKYMSRFIELLNADENQL